MSWVYALGLLGGIVAGRLFIEARSDLRELRRFAAIDRNHIDALNERNGELSRRVNDLLADLQAARAEITRLEGQVRG